jgi:hypothetical protein
LAALSGTGAMLQMYTRPASYFLRAFLLSFMGATSWFIGLRKERKVYNIFLLRNYKNFSWEVQRALQTGDSRYLRDILRQHKVIEQAEPITSE